MIFPQNLHVKIQGWSAGPCFPPIYLYTYCDIYIYIYTHYSIYIGIYIGMYTYIYIYIYVCTYTYVYDISISIYYIHIYTVHTHILKSCRIPVCRAAAKGRMVPAARAWRPGVPPAWSWPWKKMAGDPSTLWEIRQEDMGTYGMSSINDGKTIEHL